MKNTITFILIFITSFCFAQSVYISDTDGDDANSFIQAQSSLTPWKTLDRLEQEFLWNAQPNRDTIFLERGDTFYVSDMQFRIFSTALNPMVVMPYGTGANPVVTGFETISAWTSLGSGVYESTNAITNLDDELHMVAINNIDYAMGRWPNADEADGGYMTYESKNGGNTRITDNELTGTPDWDGAEIVIRANPFVIEKREITDHTVDDITFTPSTSYALQSEKYGYFIQNHIDAVDSMGEWYYNPSTKKLAVHFGGDTPDNYTVEVATGDTLFYLQQGSNFTIQDIDFRGSNTSIFMIADWGGMDSVTIRNCNFQFSGGEGVDITGFTNSVFENCTIKDCNQTGLDWNNLNNFSIVRNNVIQDIGLHPGMGGAEGPGNGATLESSPGSVFEYNTIKNTGYSAFFFYGDSLTIRYNTIDSFLINADDGSGIGTWVGTGGPAHIDRLVEGNIITNGIGNRDGCKKIEPRFNQSYGLYMDDGTTGVTLRNNTVANCNGGGTNLHNAYDLILNGNVFFNNRFGITTLNDWIETGVRGLNINENVVVATRPEHYNLRLETTFNNIDTIGTFSNNYYVMPFDKDEEIHTRIRLYNSDQLYDVLEKDEWTSEYGKDVASKTSPSNYDYYTFNSYDTGNLFTNGSWNSSAGGSYLSTSGNGSRSHDPASPLDGGAVLVDVNLRSEFVIGAWAADSTKNYLVEFSTLADRKESGYIFFRYNGWPYAATSNYVPFSVDTVRQEHSILITAPYSTPSTAISIAFSRDTLSYWTDNFSVREVDVDLIESTDSLTLEYNATTELSTIPISEPLIDAKGYLHLESVPIQPYRSYVLMKVGELTKTSKATCDNSSTSVVSCDDGNPNTVNDKQTVLDVDGSICLPCKGTPN